MKALRKALLQIYLVDERNMTVCYSSTSTEYCSLFGVKNLYGNGTSNSSTIRGLCLGFAPAAARSPAGRQLPEFVQKSTALFVLSMDVRTIHIVYIILLYYPTYEDYCDFV
jgi:hypothetical protein